MDDKMLAETYRAKAKECFDLAGQSRSDADRALFMQLAELWTKMAMQMDTIPGEQTNVTHFADHRRSQH